MLAPRDFVDIELKIVEKMFEAQKEIYPQFIIIKNDERAIVPVYFSSSARKDIIAQGIKDLVKKSEPDVVVYMAEAWVMMVKEKFDRLLVTPKHPDRIEIVFVQIEFKTGEKFGCEARIKRLGTETQLEKFEIMDASTSMGRFCDFFPISRAN